MPAAGFNGYSQELNDFLLKKLLVYDHEKRPWFWELLLESLDKYPQLISKLNEIFNLK